MGWGGGVGMTMSKEGRGSILGYIGRSPANWIPRLLTKYLSPAIFSLSKLIIPSRKRLSGGCVCVCREAGGGGAGANMPKNHSSYCHCKSDLHYKDGDRFSSTRKVWDSFSLTGGNCTHDMLLRLFVLRRRTASYVTSDSDVFDVHLHTQN